MENENSQYLSKPGSFYGVYILYNINPKHKGQIYIGFTVNPERRIRQHNREIKGGASKTGRNRGPWDMVLITYGFRTRCAALQFEWAWQYPTRSKRLSHLANKMRSESIFTYRIRILSEMLNVGPWRRLPLTIQWLKQEYICNFPIQRSPPIHMPIAYGKIASARKDGNKMLNTQSNKVDFIAVEEVKSCLMCHIENNEDNTILACIVDGCAYTSHVKCLADLFLAQSNEKNDFIVPISGTCPQCKQKLMWGDILKQKKHSVETLFSESDDEQTDQEMSDDDQFE